MKLPAPEGVQANGPLVLEVILKEKCWAFCTFLEKCPHNTLSGASIPSLLEANPGALQRPGQPHGKRAEPQLRHPGGQPMRGTPGFPPEHLRAEAAEGHRPDPEPRAAGCGWSLSGPCAGER